MRRHDTGSIRDFSVQVWASARRRLEGPHAHPTPARIAAAALAVCLGIAGCDAKPADVLDASGGEDAMPADVLDASVADDAKPAEVLDASEAEITAEQCNAPLASFLCVAPNTWCCPETFDGSAAAIPACGAPAFISAYQGTCGELTVMRLFWGTHDIVCYYAATTGALVGVRKEDDVPSYCARMSRAQTGGNPPQRTECDYNAFPVVKKCT